SEDPRLAGELGVAYVRGVQSEGVGACVKHFAANNQETARTRISVEVDERTLREIYLPAFERVVTQATPWTVMAAYNRLGGVPLTEHRRLLTTVLREEWGFEGVVVSDWDAVRDPVAVVRAGLDLQMPGADRAATVRRLLEAVASGALDQEAVDTAAGRVAALARRARPAARPAWADGGPPDDVPPGGRLDAALVDRHHALAREAAAGALTLLRNDGVLPLDPARGTVAVVGAYARSPRLQGGGSAGVDPTRVDAPLDLLRAAYGDRLRYADGYRHAPLNAYQDVPGEFQGVGGPDAERPRAERAARERAARDGVAAGTSGGAAEAGGSAAARAAATGTDPADPSTSAGVDADTERLVDEAVATARGADVVLAFVGLPLSHEVEAADRRTLALPPEQVLLLERLADLGAPVVVVLSAGSAVTTDPWDDRVAAVLDTWLAGQAGAGALVDVLLGRADPGGRTAETFPLALADTPGFVTFPGERGRVVYGEGVFVGYRWYDALGRDVRYPFGHGLSYTTFAYHDLDVEVLDAAAGRVAVSVTVTNTGRRAGHEVVQLYVGDPEAAVHRPARELRGFAKVTLDPGASQRVRLELESRDFAWFDQVAGAWRREGGRFVVEVGASSRDIRVRTELDLPDDPDLPPLVPDSALDGPPSSRFTAGHAGPAA
ncbi:glycoside hydrolase family 3 C-terminal domain-containing protein, partial [Cellulomonas sp. P4]|uniref:glycoside hydrolase family 3 C-terminal domain-containing protein n=1 Tax=Cellulomonas sp. P4 TaxID=3142533 RepID=UPI0031BAF781